MCFYANVADSLGNHSLHELFLKNGKSTLVRKAQIVQSSDDTQLPRLVTKGYVKRYLIANDGSLGVQSIYGVGDIFSLTQLFKILLNQNIYPGPETYYYETMSEAEIYSLDIDFFVEAIKSDPALYKDLFSQSGRRLRSNIYRLENLTLSSSYKRVAHQLAFLARDYGQEVKEGICIKIPLTHLDIANILSITRETVSISIAQLRKNKLIKTGRNIIVPDLEKLEDEAHS
jgi:CRP-like cAMP-binding protein